MRQRAVGRIVAAALAAALASPCFADEVTPGAAFDYDAPKPKRGSISLGFQAVHTQGSLDGSGGDVAFLRNLTTDVRSMTVSVDYRLAERWSLNASLPFISKRAVNDIGAHNPARLAQPHPDSKFLDDGRYHG
ncbi:MAG: hypothetical protein WKH68_12940, partial [Candidatus Limnocylindria bacterium]